MTSNNWSQEDLALIMRVYLLVRKLPRHEWSSALDYLLPGNTLHRKDVEQLLEPDLKGDSTYSSISDEVSSDSQLVKQSEARTEDGEALRPGEILAGRFEIVKPLGRGGMAYVYEAKDNQRRCRVALKVVRRTGACDASSSNGFGSIVKEVNISLQVANRNVCRVFDVGYHVREDGRINFLTMELLPGETLSARLKRTGRLDTAEAAEIARQLCEALQAAHDVGVLHRDFKCSNIMLINSGRDVRAVVTDFGIACWIQQENHLSDSGRSAAAIKQTPGTPVYMSPEQVRREKLTEASDIYSLGLVLYEMVVGRRPFQRDSDTSYLLERDRRLTEDPQPPAKLVAGLSENWNKSILRCLERDPGKRFLSARAVWEGLNPPPPPLPKPVLRIAAMVASLLLVVAIFKIPAVQAFLHPLPRQKDVAVLHFGFAGTNPEYKAISSGIEKFLPESLSQCCSSEGSVRFVSSSTVRGQDNTPVPSDTRHQAPAWGANLLVTGGLENIDGILKLNIEVRDPDFKVLRSSMIKIPEAKATTLENLLLEQVAGMLELKIPSGYKLPVDQTTNPRAYRLYEEGRGYLAQEQSLQLLDQAIAKLKEATQLDGNFGIAHADLADAYYRKYRYTGERQWLDEAQKEVSLSNAISNKLFAAHSVLGSILQKKGDLNGAISEFTQAINLDLGSDETRCQLATVYDKNHQKTYAEQLLQAALKRNQKNWITEDCLGALYYRHAQYTDAEFYFSAATRNAPGSPLAFLNLGGIYLSQARYREAETALRIAINLMPTASAYSNLGTAQFYLKEYAAAAESFTEAVHLRPEDHRLWRNLGDAHTLAGNLAKAIADYRQAIQDLNRDLGVNPTDCSKLEFLSLYYAKLGEQRHAMQTLTEAKCKPGNDPEFLFNLVLIYELTGQRESALVALESAVAAGYSRQEIQNAFELEQMRKDRHYQEIMNQGSSRQLV